MKTVSEIARKLGKTDRYVRYLAARGQISGAKKVGRDWLLPDNAARLARARARPANKKSVG